MDTARISVSHRQYAIASMGVVSLYEGDGSVMAVPSRGYLTLTPDTEFGELELSIDVLFREFDSFAPPGWSLQTEGSFEATAELQVETTDGQVWPQFGSLKQIQYPSDVLFRAYKQVSPEMGVEKHLIELSPRLKLPNNQPEDDDLNDVGDDSASVLGLHVFKEK